MEIKVKAANGEVLNQKSDGQRVGQDSGDRL